MKVFPFPSIVEAVVMNVVAERFPATDSETVVSFFLRQ